MNEYDVKRLALVFSVQAEIEGMLAHNRQREHLNESNAYTIEDFDSKAEELRNLAAAHNDQL